MASSHSIISALIFLTVLIRSAYSLDAPVAARRSSPGGHRRRPPVDVDDTEDDETRGLEGDTQDDEISDLVGSDTGPVDEDTFDVDVASVHVANTVRPPEVGSCGVRELRQCNCTRRGAVICLDTEFQGVSVLKSVPPGTSEVIFRGNRFTEVRDLDGPVFGRGELPKGIKLLDLNDNQIQSISGRAFNRLTALETLTLSNNDLYITDHHTRIFTSLTNLRTLYLRDTFTERINSSDTLVSLADIFYAANLTQLKKINLELNEISGFDPFHSMWCSMPNLQKVMLAHNNLTDFTPDWNCLQHVSKLDLRNNSFTTARQRMLDVLDNLPRLASVRIDMNPFVCDCNLKPFAKWLAETSLVSQEDKLKLRCSRSYRNLNTGRRLVEVPGDQLACSASALDGDLHPSYVALVIACLVIVGLVGVLAFFNRHNIATSIWGCTRQVKQVKKSNKYTHIVHDAEQGEYHV